MPKPYTTNDTWSQRAAAEGYRARSVYKLMELDERFALLKPGITVLDLGAAPGSWLQYTAQKIEPGRAIGVDLTEIHPIGSNVSLYKQDVTNIAAIEEILKKEKVEHLDLVLSDIAPNTSGVRDVDQWRSLELARAVLAIAQKFLKPHGYGVVKVFRGADFDEFLREVRSTWEEVKTVTVKASRDRSREVYLVMRATGEAS